MKNCVYGPVDAKGNKHVWVFFKITEDGLNKLASLKEGVALGGLKKEREGNTGLEKEQISVLEIKITISISSALEKILNKILF